MLCWSEVRAGQQLVEKLATPPQYYYLFGQKWNDQYYYMINACLLDLPFGFA